MTKISELDQCCRSVGHTLYAKPLLIILCLITAFTALTSEAKDLPGAAQTSYQVGNTGAFNFSLPIVIPKGTNGVQPNLGLSFSSSRGNGMLGVGWGLSGLSSISRCGKTHAVDGIKGGVLHDQSDRFCLNGSRLILVSGVYGAGGSEYRTETDSFAKIIAVGSGSANVNGGTAPSSWQVWKKDGSILEYGSTSASQFKLPATQSIHQWKLSTVSDRSGNYYEVSYRSSDGYPSLINYTINSGLVADKQVNFIYEGRTDTRTQYIVGKKITYDDRLKKIQVSKGGALIREYKFDYEYASTSKKSRVTAIIECGLNNVCMPPIQVNWKADNVGYTTTSAPDNIAAHKLYDIATIDDGTIEVDYGTWADINGDGKVDQVIAVKLRNGTEVYKTFIKTENGWDEQQQWHLPHPLKNYDDDIVDLSHFQASLIQQGQLIDVNGDGLVDVVYAYQYHTNPYQNNYGQVYKKTFLNTGNGWSESQAYKPVDLLYDYTGAVFGGYSRATQRSMLVDINGDGLVDWITSFYYRQSSATSKKKTWLNTGSSWSHNTQYKPPSYLREYYGTHQWQRADLVDVNGDGLLDWVEAYKTYWDSNTLISNTWINTGSSFTLDNTYKLPEEIFRNDGTTGIGVRRGSFVDVNGDGLKDWVRSFTAWSVGYEQKATRLNSGKGWVLNSAYAPPFIYLDYLYIGKPGWPLNTRGYFIDLNRDGLVDYSESYRDVFGNDHQTTWRNTGTTWLVDNSIAPNWRYFNYQGGATARVKYGDFVDINNDGSPEWVKSRAGESFQTRVSSLGKTDQIAKITTTMGVKIIPEFLPLTANDTLYTKRPIDSGTGVELVADADSLIIENKMYVVSELKTSRANGTGYNTSEYRYGGAQVHRKGRGFLGFKVRETINVAKGLTQKQEFNQAYPLTGSTRRAEVLQGTNTISLKQTDYGVRTLNQANGNTTLFVYPQSTTSETSELTGNGGASFRWEEQALDFDDSGNQTFSNHKVGRSAASVESETTINNSYYSANTAQWFVGQMRDSSTMFAVLNKPSITRFSEYTYDNLGRAKTVTREPNSSDTSIKLITTYDYDNYGNIETETVDSTDTAELPRINHIAYDAEHRLPSTITNALGQSSSIIYHPQCDQPATVTDENSLETTYVYDGFCRQTKVTSPIGTIATTNYETDNLSCSNCQTSPKLKVTTHTQGETPVISYYNAHSQRMLSTTSGMLGTPIEQLVEYDDYGRVDRQSQPFFLNGTIHWTSYTYDDLDRPTLTTLPYADDSGSTATITQSYGVGFTGRQWQRSQNTLGHSKTTYANALGQVVTIKDADNEEMHYAYDAQGNLNETTDAAGNQISLSYDLLGRRIGLDDPDLGVSTFTYNAFGELTTQTDAKLQAIEIEYDQLGRMVKRHVPNLSNGIDISHFIYDTAANGIGQLASISGVNGSATSYTYDALSRPSGMSTTIRGETFAQGYSYNSDGFLATQNYPDSGTASGNEFAVEYHYLNGYLSSISGIENQNGYCVEHWRADEYDALGRTKRDTLGTLVSTTRTYDPAQGVLQRIESILQVNDNATVQDLNYSYDANNNLTTRDDELTNVSESFQYDVLERLRFHHKGSETTEVRYNAIGNITYKSDVGSYTYGQSADGSGIAGAGPHALMRVDLPLGNDPLANFQVNWEWDGQTQLKSLPNIHGSTYQYDANGNIKVSGDRNVYWTAFDKPYRMERYDPNVGTSTGANYEYDATFTRIVKEQDDGQTTLYLGKDYEKITEVDGSIKHRYSINTGSSTIQIERAHNSNIDQPKYFLGDNLGSTNVILNSQGEVEQRLAFDPWGMRLNIGDPTAVNGLTNKGYTGHEMDDEVGLTNMNARIYDPYLGRFLSPDTIIPDASDMQQFNRYSYVGNNPLKFTDPTGHANTDVGSQPNNCGYGAGCGRPLLDYVSAFRFATSTLYNLQLFFGIDVSTFGHSSISPDGGEGAQETEGDDKADASDVTNSDGGDNDGDAQQNNNSIRVGDRELNPDGYALDNEALRNEVGSLYTDLSNELETEDFQFKVTGGDRYIGADGKAHSSTDGSLIGKSGAAHLRGDAVDLRIKYNDGSLVPVNTVRPSVNRTRLIFDPNAMPRHYPDRHYHLQLPKGFKR